MEEKGQWLSIVDYSKTKNISISTIRRRIKSGKIKFQQIEGKYFIHCDEVNTQAEDTSKEELFWHLEVERLQAIIAHQREEIEDLRLLIQVYEGAKRSTLVEGPPALPVM